MSKERPSDMVAPEFSRPVAVRDIDEAGCDLTIEANPEERAALAARFSLRSLSSLTASLHTRLRRGGQAVSVAGTFSAQVEQTCVVSLEPVANAVTETIAVLFVEHTAEALELDLSADFDDDEVVEPLEGNEIDLGELVAQNLYLALDSYPRAPGAELEESDDKPAESGTVRPFAELARLRRDG